MKPFFEDRSGATYIGDLCAGPFPLHIHREAEIIGLFQGEITVTAGEKVYHLQAGDTAVIFPTVIHSYERVSPDAKGVCLIFQPDTEAEYTGALLEHRPESIIVPRGDAQGEAGRMLPQVLRQVYCLPKETAPAILRACIHLLLSLTLPYLSLYPVKAESQSDTVCRVLSHLAEHYRENLSLDSVAAALNISRSYLSHIFSQQLNINFRKYINILRTDYARQLLSAGRPLTEVCYACGWEDIRTFRRAFTQLQGESPARFKKSALPYSVTAPEDT